MIGRKQPVMLTMRTRAIRSCKRENVIACTQMELVNLSTHVCVCVCVCVCVYVCVCVCVCVFHKCKQFYFALYSSRTQIVAKHDLPTLGPGS